MGKASTGRPSSTRLIFELPMARTDNEPRGRAPLPGVERDAGPARTTRKRGSCATSPGLDRLPGLIARTGVLGAGPDDLLAGPVLLQHVRAPAGGAADREERRVEVHRQTHLVVARGGEAVHVRVDALLAGGQPLLRVAQLVHDLLDRR